MYYHNVNLRATETRLKKKKTQAKGKKYNPRNSKNIFQLNYNLDIIPFIKSRQPSEFKTSGLPSGAGMKDDPGNLREEAKLYFQIHCLHEETLTN